MNNTYEEMFEAAEFFKFTNVGDTVAGRVVEISTGEAKHDFPEQKIITVEVTDGTERRIGVSAEKPFEMYCLHGIQLGDILYRKFVSELPPVKKGWSPIKNFSTKFARDGKIVSPPFQWTKGSVHTVDEFEVKDASRAQRDGDDITIEKIADAYDDLPTVQTADERFEQLIYKAKKADKPL